MIEGSHGKTFQRGSQNLCYAHIFFTDVPKRTDYDNNSDVLSIDVVTDQSPLENLRGISGYEPRFAGVVWSLTPDVKLTLVYP
ncbi:MAG: hypothetical protein CM15mP49_17730 [Actinomycetota bacterium]|nr:MAG: hypothetical protein CM15mP49_17730 [Actinomycetota bacterium]